MTMHLHVMDAEAAQEVMRWRYPPPYDFYNIPEDVDEEVVAFLTDRRNCYYRIEDDSGQVAAFCCFGRDACVPGGDYRSSALDIGLGVRPDLTGQRRGGDFVAAVCDFAEQTFVPVALRVTVAAWNARAQRVWQRAGFAQVGHFHAIRTGTAFVILTRATQHSEESVG